MKANRASRRMHRVGCPQIAWGSPYGMQARDRRILVVAHQCCLHLAKGYRRLSINLQGGGQPIARASPRKTPCNKKGRRSMIFALANGAWPGSGSFCRTARGLCHEDAARTGRRGARTAQQVTMTELDAQLLQHAE